MQHLLHEKTVKSRKFSAGGRMQLTIRPADIRSEFTAITRFYEQHGKLHLPTPEVQSLAEAAEDGQLYVAELITAPRPRIVGLAGLFHVTTAGSPNSPAAIYELAGMALDGQATGGLGPHTLQELLVWLRVCGLAREAGLSKLCVVSSVVAANHRSVEAIERCGLQNVETPYWLKTIHRSWRTNGAADVRDFLLAPGAVLTQAENLRAFLRHPELVRRNRETGRKQKFRVRVDLPWAKPGNKALKALAKGDATVKWLDAIPTQQLVQVDGEWIVFDGSKRK